MTRIVLEEVFEERFDLEGKPYQFKLGEIVIYSEQLDPAQELVCRTTWPKKYTDALKDAGYEV